MLGAATIAGIAGGIAGNPAGEFWFQSSSFSTSPPSSFLLEPRETPRADLLLDRSSLNSPFFPSPSPRPPSLALFLLTRPPFLRSTDIVLVRMTADATKHLDDQHRYRNCFDGLIRVVKDEGAQQLFRGLGPNLVSLCFSDASSSSTNLDGLTFLLLSFALIRFDRCL